MTKFIMQNPQTLQQGDNDAFSFRMQIVIGLGTLAVTAAFFIIWSLAAPLESGAVAPGKIVVDTNRKAIQHLDGGIVEKIYVKDGDIVKQGDILISLDATEATMQRNRLYAEWLSLLAKNARLNAEHQDKTTIDFPEEFQQNEFKERKKEYIRVQNSLAKARQESLQNELDIYEQKQAQLYEQINGLKKQATAGERRLSLLQEEVNDLKVLKKKEYIAKTKLLELRREYAEVLAEVAGLKASIAELKIKTGEAKLEIIRVQKKFKEEISAQLSNIRTEIFDIEDRLRSADQRRQRIHIRSPGDGVIFNSQVHTLGGVIPAGTLIMEVVPNRDRLLVEAEASPLDIESIHIGQMANVRFSSLSSRTTPLLQGRVEFIAADIHKNKYGNDVYKIRVIIEKAELNRLGDIKLVPGMPVEVLIRKGERTLVSYLLKPLTSALFRGLKED